MADQSSQLVLSAQVTRFVSGLETAAKALLRLRSVAAGVAADVAKSLALLEAKSQGAAASVKGAFAGIGGAASTAGKEARASSAEIAQAIDLIGAAAERNADKVKGAFGGIGTNLNEAAEGAKKAGAKVKQEFTSIEDAIETTTKKVTDKILSLRTALAGLGAGVALGAITKTTADFEEVISRLNIVAGDTAPIAGLRAQLLELSTKTPVGLNSLTVALTNIIGTLPKGANAAATGFEILNAAQKAAQASGSEVEQVALGVTAVLNTYGKTGVKAAEVTDKIFAAADQGGATIADLSGAIGGLVGISSTFEVSLNEAFGEIAVLTRAGQTGSEAITNLRQALISTARPPENVKKKLKELGIEFGQTALKTKGLIGILEEIDAKGGKSLLSELFTDVQGFLAASTLVSSGLKTVREDIDLIGKASGATDRAVAKTAGNFNTAAGILKNKFSAALIQIGDKLLPRILEAVDRLGKAAEGGQKDLITAITDVLLALVSLAEFIATNGRTILIFFGTVFAASKINAAVTALIAFGTALKAVVATTAAGALAGSAYVGGFAAKLKAIGPLIAGALRSPTALALIAAGAVLIGEKIGEAIGKAASRVWEEQGAAALANAQETAAKIDQILKKRGFKSFEEFEGEKGAFRRGERVSVTGKFGNAGDSAPVSEAAEKLGLNDAGLRDAAARTAAELEQQAAKAADALQGLQKELGGVQGAIKATDRAVSKSAQEANKFFNLTPIGDQVALRNALATKKILETQEEGLKATIGLKTRELEEARKGAQAVVEATEVELEARQKATEAKKKDEKDPKGPGGAAKPRIDLEVELTKILAENERARLANEVSALEEAQAAREEKAQRELEIQKALGASQLDLIALQKQGIFEGDALLLRQQELIAETAQLEIEESKRVAEARIKEVGKTAEIRAAIVQQQALQEEAIQSRLIAEQVRLDKVRVDALQALAYDRIRAVFDVAKEEFDRFLAGAIAAAAAARREALLGQEGQIVTGAQKIGGIAEDLSSAEGVVKAAARLEKAGAEAGDTLGLLAEQGGAVVGTIAGVALAIKNLPGILSGIGDFLSTGIADFVDGLAAGLEDALVGLLDGFPAQIERIFSEVVPRIITNIIGNLPKIVGGLIALIPRIVAGFIGSIPEIVQGFIDGFFQAGEQLVEFFTGDIVSAIGEGVKAAFLGIASAVGNILSFLFENTFLRIFKLAGQVFLEVFGDVPARAKEFFVEVGGIIGRGIRDAFVEAGQFLLDGIVSAFEAILQEIKDFLGAAGDFASDLVGLGDENSAAGITGRTLGLSLLGKTFTGNFEDIDAGDIPIIGGFFHSGGMIRSSGRNPGVANALAAAGAPAFAFGGMVPRPGDFARQRLSQALRSDDVPAVLQAGEGVLSRAGVRAAGGEAAVAALNRGQSPGEGPINVGVSLTGGAIDPLIAMFVRAIGVQISRPGSEIRSVVQKTGKSPLMSRAVRGR